MGPVKVLKEIQLFNEPDDTAMMTDNFNITGPEQCSVVWGEFFGNLGTARAQLKKQGSANAHILGATKKALT